MRTDAYRCVSVDAREDGAVLRGCPPSVRGVSGDARAQVVRPPHSGALILSEAGVFSGAEVGVDALA